MYKNITTNLMVESVDTSVNFYQEILGFEVVASVPAKNQELQFAILAKDSVTLMLQEKNNLGEEYPILATEKIQPSITLYITIENFEDFYIAIKNPIQFIQKRIQHSMVQKNLRLQIQMVMC